jgi:hypothetical protein
MCREGGKGTRGRLAFGFRAALAREPSETERARLLKFYEAQCERYSKQPEAARQVIGEQNWTGLGVDLPEMAAWVLVGNVLLNLDETLTCQ